MSIDQRLIVLINTAINEQIESVAKYSNLKEAVKEIECLEEPVIKYLNETLSNYDQTILTKIFHVLDYLSSIYPEKLQSLLTDEVFLEKLSFLVWEPTFQTKILSLISYWTSVYQILHINCQSLENLSETIRMSGITFPVKALLLYSNTNKISKDESSFSKPQLLKQTNDGDKSIPEYYDSDVSREAGGAAKFQSNLCHQSGDNMSGDSDSADFNTQNIQKGSKAQNGVQKNEKIENDDSQINRVNTNDALMALDEILAHKTLKCPQHDACQYKPVPNERNQYRNESLLCPYFHSILDQRRPLSNKKGLDELEYSPKSCRFSSCNKDICELSHGFFEKMFHPLNYKKERCDKTQKPVCIAQKYCPYYHTASEKTRWETILGQFRQIKDDITELQEVPEEIEMVDITNNSDQTRTENFLHYPSRFQRRYNQKLLEPIVSQKREFINVKSDFKDRNKFFHPSELSIYGLNRIISCTSKNLQSQDEITNLLEFNKFEEYCRIYSTTEKFNSMQ